MRLTGIIVFLEYLGMFQYAVWADGPSLLTAQHRQIVACLNNIVQSHLRPRGTLFITLSSTSAGHKATARQLTGSGDFGTVAAFLHSLNEHAQWAVEVSQYGGAELDVTYEDFHKHDYIIFTGYREEASGVVHTIIEQVNKIYTRISWNFRARFIIVTEVYVTVSLPQLAIKIFEELWKYYSIMNVLLIISVAHLKVNDTISGSSMSHGSPSESELLLYTWFPYISQRQCDRVMSPVLIDRWTSKGEFALKANLFPDKVPKTFQGCKSKIYSYHYPPAVQETSPGEYSGFEINYIKLIFQKLNLTPVYKMIPYRYYNHVDQFLYTIRQLEQSSSDIAIGVMPFGESTIAPAEATIPYTDVKILWHVPCPKQVSRWITIYEIFSLQVWLLICVFATGVVISMWLLAKYGRNHRTRESPNYMTIICCIYNLWAIMTGVSVPEKPISNGLRIIFIGWVCFSLSVSTVFQALFVEFLVNPRFEKRITTLSELIESKIQYGIKGNLRMKQFSDPIYETIYKNRTVCKSMLKCMERVIRNNDFATVTDTFHAEYFKIRLLSQNIHIPFCTLREDITRYSISTYMAKGTSLLKTFNRMIRYLFEAGLFQKWYSDFMNDIRLGGQSMEGDDASLEGIDENYLSVGYSSYSLSRLQVVFYTLLLGDCFSTLAFLGELLYSRTWVVTKLLLRGTEHKGTQ
jgi:hypothetical protein